MTDLGSVESRGELVAMVGNRPGLILGFLTAEIIPYTQINNTINTHKQPTIHTNKHTLS